MKTALDKRVGKAVSFRPHRAQRNPTGQELSSLRLPDRQCGGKTRIVTVNLAETDECMQSASSLINRMYAWRGYGSEFRLSGRPCEMTFTAFADGEAIGTITLAADSESGLSVDKTFPDEMARFREFPGSSLCELTKFAVDSEMSAKALLASLFHTVFIYGSDRFGSTDLFIEVNPRHVRFYEAMLGFKRVGDLRTNLSVNAPSQLMWLSVATIGKMIEAHAGTGGETSRSLYPYFYGPEEVEEIRTNLSIFGPDRPTADHFAVPQLSMPFVRDAL